MTGGSPSSPLLIVEDDPALQKQMRWSFDDYEVVLASDRESALAQIWGEVLGVEQVGRHDNFFELGGHSLLAVTLIERMRQVDLSTDVRVLFSQPTLAALAASVGSDFLVDVDVTDDASLDACFGALKDRWGTMDFLVHAIAFSDKNELTGRFINTSRANFSNSLAISCFSFIDVSRRAAELMPDGGTLTIAADCPDAHATAAAGVGEAVCLTASRRRRRRGVIKLTLASWQMRFIQCWGVRNILFFILIPTYVARKDPEALWVQLTEKYVCIVLSLYIMDK